MISIINKKAPVKAKLVQLNQTSSCLVASFQTSEPALVWEMNLDKVSGFSMVLKEKEGEWDLGTISFDGTFTTIAHFEDFDDAQDAFKAIEKVLLRGVRNWSFARFLKTVLYSLFMLLLIGLVLSLLFSFAPKTESVIPSASNTTTQGGESAAPELSAEGGLRPRGTAPAKIETGVPMTADDVLPKNVQ